MVRVTGVEPACLAALDPKSSASANFATPAVLFYYSNTYTKNQEVSCHENWFFCNIEGIIEIEVI